MPFTAAELITVVAGPAMRLGGMQITSVELFDDSVIVRSHQLLPKEPDDPIERRQLLGTALELEDDQGTPYRPVAIPHAPTAASDLRFASGPRCSSDGRRSSRQRRSRLDASSSLGVTSGSKLRSTRSTSQTRRDDLRLRIDDRTRKRGPSRPAGRSRPRLSRRTLSEHKLDVVILRGDDRRAHAYGAVHARWRMARRWRTSPNGQP